MIGSLIVTTPAIRVHMNLRLQERATTPNGNGNVATALFVWVLEPWAAPSAGNTVHMDLGGTGRAVVGKLRPPQGFDGKVYWQFAIATLQSGGPKARPVRPSFKVTVAGDGGFPIDDVPAGCYSLSVRFQRDGVGRLRDQPVTVPSTQTSSSDEPIDLRTLTLEEP